uniref:Uncharacterized protein n=1 Tax=Candidatus Kentrum eta TaxID=2126337 RepID=A0A450UTE9_9GAMM|nr:MAG: hypothetical protein BECKH772A_GA0070896_1000344 [Candidatus Kentron sp. H]VFJ89124.1 MAG: hypothetical protein BECKH772B_GA0070898_1000343 [Candidatus Kentron sp. H]VFJ95817.1 MAG: hypothetical protein BECKH772C_GA0070978_1000343 [Candidatus Kentron sp. H]
MEGPLARLSVWDFEVERLATVKENLNPLQRLEPLGLGHYGHFLMIPNFRLPSSSLYVGVMRYLQAYVFSDEAAYCF